MASNGSDNSGHSAAAPASVSILIAAHNRCELLARTLESLTRLQVPAAPVECIVIANACTDDTEGVVNRMAASGRMPFPLRVVAEPRRGVSFARNRAVQEARHDLLAFIDSDCLADPAWLIEHLRVYSEGHADLVTGRIELWWEKEPAPTWLSVSMLEALGQHRFSPDTVQLTEPRAYAANFSFRRAVFEKVGPFRTDIGRSGLAGRLAHEETVFARRAMEQGFKFWWTPRAVVNHWAPESSISDEFFARSAYWGSVSYMITDERLNAAAVAGLAARAMVRAGLCTGKLAGAKVRGDAHAASIARMDRMGALGRVRGAWTRLTGLSVPRP